MFEKAEKDVCDEFFMINSTGRCPQVVESRKELEEISELRMKRIAQKGTSQHSFSVKKLKTVSGYKRQGATVTRLSGGRLKYRIAGETQGSMVSGLISVLALEVLGELRDKHESLRRANISNEFSVKYASIGQGNGDKK